MSIKVHSQPSNIPLGLTPKTGAAEKAAEKAFEAEQEALAKSPAGKEEFKHKLQEQATALESAIKKLKKEHRTPGIDHALLELEDTLSKVKREEAANKFLG